VQRAAPHLNAQSQILWTKKTRSLSTVARASKAPMLGRSGSRQTAFPAPPLTCADRAARARELGLHPRLVAAAIARFCPARLPRGALHVFIVNIEMIGSLSDYQFGRRSTLRCNDPLLQTRRPPKPDLIAGVTMSRAGFATARCALGCAMLGMRVRRLRRCAAWRPATQAELSARACGVLR
jgi:hypothetical protein